VNSKRNCVEKPLRHLWGKARAANVRTPVASNRVNPPRARRASTPRMPSPFSLELAPLRACGCYSLPSRRGGDATTTEGEGALRGSTVLRDRRAFFFSIRASGPLRRYSFFLPTTEPAPEGKRVNGAVRGLEGTWFVFSRPGLDLASAGSSLFYALDAPEKPRLSFDIPRSPKGGSVER
jgi:hypothetical protein